MYCPAKLAVEVLIQKKSAKQRWTQR